MTERKQFEFKVVEQLGVLTVDETATITKELNKVAWNGGKATIELRSWKKTENEKQPLKGIILTVDELKALKSVLNGLDLTEMA